MNFFDLHVHSAFSGGESSLEQLATAAKNLGYRGFCFSVYYKNADQIKQLQEEIEKVKQKIGMEIFLGFEARTGRELEILREKRRRFDVLLVHGGDLKMNRLAVETPEVDVLTHPESGRYDPGMNHVLMKMAAKNNVALEINLHEVLSASKKTRAKILQNISKNVMLAKKFKAPIVVCSSALSHWEMKDPQVLVSFATLFGLNLKEAKGSLTKVPEKILNRAGERKSEKWIMPGVKVLKGGKK